ncbi:hypothetical protein KAW18_01025 [candidate division WOR-3 bacterium]|nr:hypothetical protein [candidate division WOR-3 bacterium]
MSGPITHGHTKNGKRSPEYRCWEQMKARCQNSNNISYENYGGRGISICERWHSFENFYEDMGDKPEGLTLERKNNNGNYEPGNCQWTTWKEQNNNRRPNSSGRVKQRWFQAISPNGKIFYSNNQHEFAREHGLNHSHISSCLRSCRKIHLGWTFTRIEEKII